LTFIKIMGVWDLLWHLAGLAAPAWVLAPVMASAGLFFKRNRPLGFTWLAQAAINFVVCLIVLVAGLVLTGHDGRMATYAVLVLASATCQWAVMR